MRADAGMGVRAAHEGCVQRAGQVHVIDELAAAGQQRRVFEARDPCAEVLRAHPGSNPAKMTIARMRRAGEYRPAGTAREEWRPPRFINVKLLILKENIEPLRKTTRSRHFRGCGLSRPAESL